MNRIHLETINMNANKIIADIYNKTTGLPAALQTLHKIKMASLCSVVLLAVACTPAQPMTSPVAKPAGQAQVLTSPVAQSVENPSQGTTTVTGIAMSGVTQKPLVGIPVYLAEVFRKAGDPPDAEGAFVLDVSHSPSALTDATGRFAIINIPAKEYVLVIGDPYNKSEVVAKDDGKPRLFLTQADHLLDVGSITVKF